MNANTSTGQAQRPLADARWRLDPSASTAEFRVPHFWGLVTVKGHFERLDGYLELDDCGQRQMTLTIDAASLHTGINHCDKHLRSSDFFDTDSSLRVGWPVRRGEISIEQDSWPVRRHVWGQLTAGEGDEPLVRLSRAASVVPGPEPDDRWVITRNLRAYHGTLTRGGETIVIQLPALSGRRFAIELTGGWERRDLGRPRSSQRFRLDERTQA